MADDKITVGIDLQDDLTPKIANLKKELSDLGDGGEKIGEQVGFIGKQLEELKAGLGYTIGAWNVGFALADKAVGFVTDSIRNYMVELKEMGSIQNRLNLSNVEAAKSFEAVKEAALLSGTSVGDTAKRTMTLVQSGFSLPEATKVTQAIQQRFKETNVDLTEITAKAKFLAASVEDIVAASAAGGPFGGMRGEALRARTEEAMRPYEELRMSQRQLAENRAFQDRVLMINREMDLRHLAADREMQDIHRAIEYEMADRHRLAAQAEQDVQRAYSLQMGGLGAIPGAMDVLGGRATKTPMGYVAAQALRPEYEKGLTEMAKDTGLAVDQLREAVQEGMSPSVVLQYAQAGRETVKIANERARESESIKTGRTLQQDSLQMARREQDERLTKTIEIQDTELSLQRRNQDERIDFEKKFTIEKLRLNLEYNTALEDDIRKRAIELGRLYGGAGIPPTAGQRMLEAPAPLPFPFNLFARPGTAAGALRPNLGPELVGTPEMVATEATLQKVNDLLERILSGG